jgi:hypothetical protein
MARTLISTHIDERTTQRITATMKDEAGAVLPAASVTACTFTLYVLGSLAIINSRDDVNILNANGGTWGAAGEFALELVPADNAIADAALSYEDHVALIEWTYTGGKQGREEVVLTVRNMAKVP